MSEQVASMSHQELLDRIEAKTVKIGVVGLGYVGLPLAEVFCRAGLQVTGFDVDPKKAESVLAGKTYIEDLSDEQIKAQVDSGRLHATTDFDGLAEMDAILICVPTPLRKTLDPDISYVVAVAKEIGKRLRPGQLIVLESTTYPGTTDEVVKPLLEESGHRVGEEIYLAFSPERVDPSNPTYKTENTPKVVGGATDACCRAAEALYSAAIPQVHVVTSCRAAEMVKLLENTFRMINIGLVNEIAQMCEKLELDVWEVVDAAATKPFGFMPFYPGPGLGGHCIPIDPHYLSWKLKSLNFFARFIELASEINRGMPAYVVGKVAQLLNGESKAIRGSKILVVGVAYKSNTSDTRESPAIDVMKLLAEQGAVLSYHDRFVDKMMLDGVEYRGLPLDGPTVDSHDLVLILTNHPDVDYQVLADRNALVFDTRNATRDLAKGSDRIIKL